MRDAKHEIEPVRTIEEPARTVDMPEHETAPSVSAVAPSAVTAKLDAVTAAIRAERPPSVAGLCAQLAAARTVVTTHLAEHRRPADALALSGRVQNIVDAATDVLWTLFRADTPGLDPARDRIEQLAKLMPGVVTGKLPELLAATTLQDTHEALHAVEKQLLRIQGDTVGYMIENLTWYAMRTSSNPRVSRDGLDEKLLGLAEKGLNKSYSYFVEKRYAKVIIAALDIGETLGKVLTSVASFVVGKAIDKLFKWIFNTEQYASEEMRRAVAFSVGGFLRDELIGLVKELGPNAGTEAVRARMGAIDTDEDAQALTAALREQSTALQAVKAPTGFDVGKSLLQRWVLENAGEDDNAGKEKHVSTTDWKRALVDLQDGNENATEINDCPDLFIHQTRGHFARMGFALDGDVAAIPKQLETYVVRQHEDAEDNAGDTYDAVDNRPLSIKARVADIGAVQRLLGEEGKQLSALGVVLATVNGFEGTLRLDLGIGSNSVYVDSWDYDIAVAGVGSSPPMPLFLDVHRDIILDEPVTTDPFGRPVPNSNEPNRLKLSMSPD